MSDSRTGFAVIYRWRIHEGMEEVFQEAWAILTRAIMKDRGGLGSRLHQAEDGLWTAYAQWPTRKDWEKSQEMESVDPEASARMKEALQEAYPPLLLVPVADLLVNKGIVEQ